MLFQHTLYRTTRMLSISVYYFSTGVFAMHILSACIHCKKIVILTKEVLFEFQMSQIRVTDVFSTFLKHSDQRMGSTLNFYD